MSDYNSDDVFNSNSSSSDVLYVEETSFSNETFANLTAICGNMDEHYIHVWQTFQWWCEGILFTGIGLCGLIANCFSIGILCTQDMRKHSFNQLLIALCIFDLLFIVVSIPVYSFNLFQIFVGNQFFNYLYVHVLYPLSPVSLCASVYMTVALTIERWLAVCKPIMYRNMNQTISTSRRVAMYVTPVVLLSVCLNIPKFMENQVKETDNSTQIDLAETRLEPTYMLYYTISLIFHPTLTTGLVPMGILIFMNLAIFKGIRRTHALRDQRRQNLNQHINNHQAAASNLQPPGNNNNNSAVSQPQQQSQQQSQQRTSETSLAIALMGIVVMHIVCQILRVFLAGLAVYFIHDTLFCLQKQVGFAPPLWTMCAESVSSLLIMINFSGNFLIYCSMLPPFKEALSKICTFLCFWKSACCAPAVSPEINSNSPGGGGAETLLPPTQNGSTGRQVLVISHRELVPGEPPKTARVLRLLSKRRRENRRSQQRDRSPFYQTQVSEVEPSSGSAVKQPTTVTNDEQKIEPTVEQQNADQAPLLPMENGIAANNTGDVVVQVTIENQNVPIQNTDDVVL